MLTIDQIKQEIGEIQLKKNASMDKGEQLKFQNQIHFRNGAIRYLETKPTEEFVRKCLKACQDKIEQTEDKFSQFYDANAKDISSMRTAFYNKNGIPATRQQAKLFT